MRPSHFPTPEAAALAGFDPRYARVVKVEFKSDEHAIVELATNEEPYLYAYFVHCHLEPEGWTEGVSHN
jgi:hypothetical protein